MTRTTRIPSPGTDKPFTLQLWRFPKDLHHEAKTAALAEHMTISEWYQQAVRQMLAAERSKREGLNW